MTQTRTAGLLVMAKNHLRAGDRDRARTLLKEILETGWGSPEEAEAEALLITLNAPTAVSKKDDTGFNTEGAATIVAPTPVQITAVGRPAPAASEKQQQQLQEAADRHLQIARELAKAAAGESISSVVAGIIDRVGDAKARATMAAAHPNVPQRHAVPPTPQDTNTSFEILTSQTALAVGMCVATMILLVVAARLALDSSYARGRDVLALEWESVAHKIDTLPPGRIAIYDWLYDRDPSEVKVVDERAWNYQISAEAAAHDYRNRYHALDANVARSNSANFASEAGTARLEGNALYPVMGIALLLALISALRRPPIDQYTGIEHSPSAAAILGFVTAGAFAASVLGILATSTITGWEIFALEGTTSTALLIAVTVKHVQAALAFRAQEVELNAWRRMGQSAEVQAGEARYLRTDLANTEGYIATLKSNNLSQGLAAAEAKVARIRQQLAVNESGDNGKRVGAILHQIRDKRAALHTLKTNAAPREAVEKIHAEIKSLRSSLPTA